MDSSSEGLNILDLIWEDRAEIYLTPTPGDSPGEGAAFLRTVLETTLNPRQD